ncbi:MAG: hypothetical protein HYT94_05560 [Parcubacteria group bacterium]|nr:hypothetical protein [Parcubacteria group bacterium]
MKRTTGVLPILYSLRSLKFRSLEIFSFLIVFKFVKTGRGGRQQNYLACSRFLKRKQHRLLQAGNRRKSLKSSFFQKTLFFEEFANSKQYLEMTSYAVAKAIFKRAEENYTASIFIDGFTKREVEKFEKDLRGLRVKKRKVRSIRKKENDGLIRLADALCGLVRDARDGNLWAVSSLAKLKKRGIASNL